MTQRTESNVTVIPRRFFGPVSLTQAEVLTEDVLNSTKLYKALFDYATGEIEPAECMYWIQCAFEQFEEFRFKQPKREYDEGMEPA